MEPDLVAGMEVLEELGQGAQTVVYRARRQGVEYALKVLRRSGPDDERALTAFRREAALLACVDHPGLARIHEVELLRLHAVAAPATLASCGRTSPRRWRRSSPSCSPRTPTTATRTAPGSSPEQHLRRMAQLPAQARAAAIERVRAAAGPAAPLLKSLSPTLSALLRAPDLAEEDRQEQFTTAVAKLLVELARDRRVPQLR